MEMLRKQIAEWEALDIAPTKRPDFDAFWEETCALCRTRPLHVRGSKVDHPIARMEVRDLTYEGLDGTPVAAWLLLPEEAKTRRVPCVVCYHGAGGHRGEPESHLAWVAMGAAVISMDFRLQGGSTGTATPPLETHAGSLGWTVFGIRDKKTYIKYHSWTDCLRGIELARQTPEIDPARIVVQGGSQGGGASLAMAALAPDVALCMADVPADSWMEKRIMNKSGAGASYAEYIRKCPGDLDAVMTTMSYFDNINLADRIQCPTLVSVGSRDPVVPPDTSYAAFNKIRAPKEIVVYPFAEHEGGGAIHHRRKLEFYRKHIGS